jgi:hypothetical protein
MALSPPSSFAPAGPDIPTWSSRTLLIDVLVGDASVAFTAGTSVPTIVPRKTASTSPVTERKAAFGLSASRRLARSGAAPAETDPTSRAVAHVNHGPAITSPTIVRSSPG